MLVDFDDVAINERNEILIEYLYVSDHNVRKDKLNINEDIENLANNIKENGLLNPITICKNNNKYEIIAGQRRYLAAKSLGWKRIKCNLVDNVNEFKKLVLSLSENIERKDMSNYDKIKTYSELWKYNTNFKEIEKAIKITKPTFDKYIRISRLDDDIIRLLDIKPKKDSITLEVADELSKAKGDINYILNKLKDIKNADKATIIRIYNEDNISIENAINKFNNKPVIKKDECILDPETKKFVKIPDNEGVREGLVKELFKFYKVMNQKPEFYDL